MVRFQRFRSIYSTNRLSHQAPLLHIPVPCQLQCSVTSLLRVSPRMSSRPVRQRSSSRPLTPLLRRIVVSRALSPASTLRGLVPFTPCVLRVRLPLALEHEDTGIDDGPPLDLPWSRRFPRKFLDYAHRHIPREVAYLVWCPRSHPPTSTSYTLTSLKWTL
jgi:hypothetical protein